MKAAKHPLRFQQRFVDEGGFYYLLKLLNNPNQYKDILENCLLIAGNFMWNNNENRKIVSTIFLIVLLSYSIFKIALIMFLLFYVTTFSGTSNGSVGTICTCHSQQQYRTISKFTSTFCTL
jgi:hypothetical protein